MLNGEEEEEEEEDMAEETYINIPEYWATTQVRPRGFAEICDMVDTQGRITGIWEFVQSDPKTGDVRKRIVNKNIITDNGAVNILGSAIANASNANPWNQILITNNSGSTTLTTALTNGQTGVTSLAVAALPAAIPSGSTIQIGFGTGQTQNVVTSAIAAQAATSITVTSFTSNAAYAIGSAVVPVPQLSDNIANASLTANATTGLTSYSGVITAGGFTYAATTGAGNRSCVITFTFKTSGNGGSTATGSYSDAFLVNSGTAGSTTTGIFVGNYIAHEINVLMACNSSNNISVSITVKL